MKNTQLSSELKNLIAEKSNVCVSLVIPLHQMPLFKKIDSLVVDHAIRKLQALMSPRYDAPLVREFIEKVKYLKNDIRYINGVKGIGIFMSENTFYTTTFPFEVQERIHAGSSFEVRDLLYKELYLREYYLLGLSGSEVNLFKGHGGTLTEIKNEHFPASTEVPVSAMPVGEALFESRPALKRNKSVMMESSASFYNQLDKKLFEYIGPETLLLLSGIEKEIALFGHTSVHSSKICGKINGSYEDYNFQELENKAWEMIQACQEKNNKKLLASLPDLFGKEMLSIGIQNVWRNALQGKGNVLLVEKSYAVPGFVTADNFYLWLKAPAGAYSVITDAADDLIETVLTKNGQVVFVPQDSLAEYQRIVMINRY